MQKIKATGNKDATEEILKCIGMSPNKIGFIYLKAIINKMWEENGKEQKKFNYYVDIIGKETGLSFGQIYPGIKYAIEEAWFLGDFNIIEYIFGYSVENVVTEAPKPDKFVDGILNIISEIERNGSDVIAFFNFLKNGGYAIGKFNELNYLNKYKI